MIEPLRWARAEIDLGAIADNVRVLLDRAAPAAMWAVVKADAYGHGAVPVARTALAAGAAGLCVALVQEGVELRRAGIEAPILLLSEQPADQAPTIITDGLIPTVYSEPALGALVAAGAHDLAVHVKVDTGMQRVGVAPEHARALVEAVRAAAPALRLGGVFTHLAVADDPEDPFTAEQLARFDDVLADLDLDPSVVVHAANSAATLAHRAARRTLVRVGIAMYGIEPGPGVAHLCSGLRPAMALRARVSQVKRVRAGSRISYGLRHEFATDTTVATIPIGYADGVPRRLSASARGESPGPDTGAVLIGGRRCPIVGVVTMDQLMVECGEAPVAVGEEVVLIGVQGEEQITVEEWAALVGTIGYEITCGISGRVPRIERPSIVG